MLAGFPSLGIQASRKPVRWYSKRINDILERIFNEELSRWHRFLERPRPSSSWPFSPSALEGVSTIRLDQVGLEAKIRIEHDEPSTRS